MQTIWLQIRETISINRWAEFSALAGLVATLFWAFPWFYSLAQPEAAILVTFIFLLVGSLLCYACGWLMNTLSRESGWLQGITLGLVLSGAAFFIHPLFFQSGVAGFLVAFQKAFEIIGQTEQGVHLFMGLAGYLLLMGKAIRQASHPVGISENIRNFQIGSIAFLLYGITFAAENPGMGLFSFCGFLMAGMIAMTAGRWAEIARNRGGRMPEYTSRRAILLWLVPVLLTGVVIGLGYLVTGGLSAVIASLITVLLSSLLILIVAVLSPLLVILVEVMYRIGVWIFSRAGELLPQSPAAEIAQEMQQIPPEEIFKLDQVVENYQRLLVIGILIAGVIVLALFIRWKPWKRGLVQVENDTDGISPARNTARQPGENHPKFGFKFMRFSRMAAAARIRYIYYLLLSLAEKKGAARPGAMTPLEFLPRLLLLFPECGEECQLITQAYVRIRYGQLPETTEELLLIRQSWEKIRLSQKAKKS